MVTAKRAAMRDLLMLESVEEDLVLNQLAANYTQHQQVYTFLGPVLIALNPYRQLMRNATANDQDDQDAGAKKKTPPTRSVSIYDLRFVKEFSGKELHLCAPHPFAIAESAYSDLMRFGRNQSLLITGESGSGKTETSKHVMHYITNISTKGRRLGASADPQPFASGFSGAGSAASSPPRPSFRRKMSIQEKQDLDVLVSRVIAVLWGSNPVLEAFGNAQTIRNNNSSRFGKFIVLQLNHSGQVIGGFIQNYLLEKSRLIRQTQGERSFHAFYQLLAGATSEEKEEWSLLDTDQFAFLGGSSRTIDGVDDQAEHAKVAENMAMVGISAEERSAVYRLLAAILWIGNILFDEEFDDAHNKCAVIQKPSSRTALETASRLLGLVPQQFEQMITFRTIKIAGDEQKVLFNARQATKVCHSIAKSLYEKLFQWLVHRINASVKNCGSHNQQQHAIVKNSIGILDIYGFEIVQENQFEQLCINYVNEKLQQLFISQTLEVEQQEYRREGIAWTPIRFFNNQIVCDLIEDVKTHGLFPILDEQCAISRFNEQELVDRYNAIHGKHAHYTPSRIVIPSFTITHYAGQVEYDATLFIEANVDIFFTNLHDAMVQSSCSLVQEIFEDTRTEKEKLKRPPSTCQQFRQQVSELLKQLENCTPHYIRCIKPNEKKCALQLEDQLVRDQIRCLGLVENLSVRRQGFCYRETYAMFIKRYKCLSNETWPNVKSHSLRQGVQVLLSSTSLGVRHPESRIMQKYQEDDPTALGYYALGRNRVFLKHPQALSALEIAREKQLPTIVNILERAWKRYKMRIKCTSLLAAYEELNTAYDRVLTNCLERRKRYSSAKSKSLVKSLYATWDPLATKLLKPESSARRAILQREETNNHAAFLQCVVRAKLYRTRFLRLRKAQIVFAKHFRGLRKRKSLNEVLYRRCKLALLGVRTEFERFLGQKKRRRDSLDREYKGDYLDVQKFPAYAKILQARGPQKLLFVAQVIKVNERFVHQPRVLMIGETHLFNIKANRLEKPYERRTIALDQIAGVMLSTLPDNYLIIKIPSEFDLVLVVNQKTEVVQVLRNVVRRRFNRELPVHFADSIDFLALKGRQNKITFSFNRRQHHVEWKKQDRHSMHVIVGV